MVGQSDTETNKSQNANHFNDSSSHVFITFYSNGEIESVNDESEDYQILIHLVFVITPLILITS